MRHFDHQKYADVAYYGVYDHKNLKIKSMFSRLSENIHFIGVIIDDLQTLFQLERKSVHQSYALTKTVYRAGLHHNQSRELAITGIRCYAP